MDATTIKSLIQQACDGPVIRKLDDLAFEATGVGFLVFWSVQADGSNGVYAAGTARDLPEFCRLLHSVPEGRSRCMACHQLLALSEAGGACVKENVCHGGASVVTAPVRVAGLPRGVDIIVVSTCAFSLDDRQRGWRLARRRALDLKIDLKKLHEAYRQLPELKGRNLSTARSLVDAAAEALAEALRNAIGTLPPDRVTGKKDESSGTPEAQLRDALHRIQARPLQGLCRPSGSALVDIVKVLVEANPQMIISVADIARVARITPNHFSMLFHKTEGLTFRDFLIEKRLALAKTLLRDLTLSILEVSLRSGFKDPGYFAKVFRKKTGQAPGEWRRTPPS